MTQPTEKLRDLLKQGVGSRPPKTANATVSLSDADIEKYLARIAKAFAPKGAPHQGPTLIDHLVGELVLTVDTYTDGTTTEVFIRNPDDPTTYLGRGVARRRKGDPRDIEVGHTIGLARALHDYADALEAELR